MIVIVSFEHSSNLAAYGIAVTKLMVLTPHPRLPWHVRTGT
ncbi:hypothetical protein ACNKHX_23260 [Shigella flexneri]